MHFTINYIDFFKTTRYNEINKKTNNTQEEEFMYLQKIQKVLNVFKILVTIDMVMTFVYAGFLIVGGTTAIFCDDPVIGKIGNTTIMLPMPDPLEYHGAVYAANGVAALLSAIILVGIANYLNQELKDGTPFTVKGADMLKRLGIRVIILSAVSSAVQASILAMYKIKETTEVTELAEVSLGICFIIFSMIIRYGTQVNGDKKALISETPDSAETNDNANT